MLTVKQLIKELNKMPQNLPVGVAHHDNSEHEVAGWVFAVMEDTDNQYTESTGKKCVILEC